MIVAAVAPPGARGASARAALRAEWTKQRTAAGQAWLLLAVGVLTVAASAAAAGATRCAPVGACGFDPARLSLSGVQVGQALVVVLAVGTVGAEYGTGMIRVTLTAVPNRLLALAAKAVVVAVPVVVVGVVAVLGSLLAGRLLLPGHGAVTALSLTDGPVLRAAGGSVLYLALVALMALGVAGAVRDTALATGIVLGLLYLFPIVAAAVTNPRWQRRLEQVGPMDAGLAIQVTSGLRDLPIGPWPGLGVLAAWSAGALLAGALVLRFRDA